MNTDLPVCTCTGQGKPIMLDGQMVIFRDPACRVHNRLPGAAPVPVSKERGVGDWNRREREK
jgi:hypothetical protein